MHRCVTEVRITPPGRGVTRLVRRAASTIYRQAFAGVSARDIRQLNGLLQRVSANISDAAPTLPRSAGTTAKKRGR